MSRKYFGTDGIRGEANGELMSVETALRLGQAVATVFSKADHKARILVGKDTRLSGYMLEAALTAGITSTGANVIALGPVPTPGIAFLTTSMRCDAGIVLSASHNPFGDNGLKVFGADGYKLPDDVEKQLEHYMDHPELNRRVTGRDIGRARRIEDATGRYVTHLKTLLRPEFDLEGLKIVVDCANGASYKAAPTLFSELGANVIPLGTEPNGLNINDGVGSLFPQRAAIAVLEHGADLGISLDGDADRLILIDEKGQVLDGDIILALCGLELHRMGQLAHNTVVATSMSNLGLEIALKEAGIALERTQVGDRYVVQRMREKGFNFGGEQSGHLIFNDHSTTGDGLVAALQVLNVMLRSGKRLSELSKVMTRVPQLLVSRYVNDKPALETLENVQKAIQNAETDLDTMGRVVVRYSGTEAKVRVMVEGTDENIIQKHADSIVEAFGKDVGFPT